MSDPMSVATRFNDLKVTYADGEATVHYLSSGSPEKPTILLLHGDKYHVLAPDLPGFGLTKVPQDFKYTFDNLAAVILAWIKALKLKDLAIYVFDYGAPVGYKIASTNPGLVKAIITQNGNAYEEGFGKDFWAPLVALWESENSADVRSMIEGAMMAPDGEGIKPQYTVGVPDEDISLVDPITWKLDYWQNLAGKANAEKQLDLFYDYRTNITAYPSFHKYFRESKVPILAVWGKGDVCFIPPGAEAFKKDSPDVEIHFVDAGHFALETKRGEIVSIMRKWLNKIGF